MKHSYSIPVVTAAMLSTAVGETIYSGLLDIAIPLNLTGTTVNIAGGTINPFFGGVGVANNDLLQPARVGTGNLDTILNFAAGSTIGSGLYFSTGYGGSQDHLGITFTAGQEGYIGFKVNGTNYGWMRVVFDSSGSGAVIRDWAYDNSGSNLIAGGVQAQESAPVNGTRTVTFSPAVGESFTLGSAITNTGGDIKSLVKTGSGTTVLSGTNTYTGATTISAGTLRVTSSGSIANSTSVTIGAGARLAYNSSTSLTVGPELNGDGVDNRAILGGTGTISTEVTLDNVGDVLAPGNSPGIQNYTVSQSWSSFSYEWELNSFTSSSAGTAYDQIAITGQLSLTGGTGSYILDVLSLTSEDIPGEVADFSEINRSWNIITTTGGIVGFNSANWTINTDGFANSDNGVWSLNQNGNNLVLSYSAIPEPSSALIGTLSLWFLLRRRRA